jgi:helix-turn-helix protein
MPPRVDTWPWQRAVCSEHGPQSAQCRLILLALATFMDPNGSNAHPSQATLAKCAQVSLRSVVRYLEAAKRDGWLATHGAGRNGRGWRLNGYEATVPDAVYAVLKTPKRGERRAPRRKGKGGEPGAPRSPRGSAPDGTEVVHLTTRGGAPGAHNPPITYPMTSCAAPPSPARAGSAAHELDSEQIEFVRDLYRKRYSVEEIARVGKHRGITFEQIIAETNRLAAAGAQR